jgi:Protein of unknown function (DUF3352)
MPRKNKWTIVPFIVAATLILILLYFFTATKNSKPAEPLNAIPISASVIIKINDLEGLFEKTGDDNPIWHELRNIPLFERIDRQIKFVDSLTRSMPDVENIINNTPSFISAHLSGKDRISLMHVLRLPPRTDEKDIRELIGGLLLDAGTLTTRKYEGIEINEVALLDKSDINNFSFAVSRDILMLSFSVTVLEDAIRQLSSSVSLASEPDFKRIYATAGKNVDANVFVNFREFPRSLSSFVKTEYKSEVRALKNFAGWAELDLNPLSEMLLMNGFVNPSDSVHTMASILAKQSPHRIMADEVLPSSVSAFFALNLSDATAYLEGYRELLQEEGRLTAYNNTLQSINNAYGTRFPEEFIEVMDKEIVLGIEGNLPEGTEPGIYLLFRIKSKAQAETKFRSVVTSMAATESQPVDTYVTTYRFDADLSFKIYELPVRKLTAKVFGSVFSVLDKHYFVVLDNYLVFSGSVESIKSLIRAYVLNKTLVNDQAYKEFKSNLSPRSNFCFYCNLSESQSFFSYYLTPEISGSWQKNLGVFQKIRMAGLQLYANNNMLYSNVLIKHLSSFSASAQTVWESKLDTLADFKPVFTLNHQTGENEVFVQDMNNTIYLINQVGRILWKIRLPGPIISDVFQVDYFRNGKLQLLFSTRNSIYLVDRNGNFVDKYPVSLRSPATNGVSVFDYDRNRDYRLFVACEDRHVYAYKRDGALLDGWDFGLSESEVTQPINHFRIGDRDFLVFGDRYKTYILDRRGSARVNVDIYFQRSPNNNYILNLTPNVNGPSVVTTDTTGKVYFIGFNGSVRTVELPGKFTGRHFFDYKDLNGDNKPEYIFVEEDRLIVYSSDESRLFTFRFGMPVSSRPMFYQFSSTDRKLGVVSREENLIYLINSNGELYQGFPLQGNTPFSIGNFGDSLSRFNLIVGSRDNFLYNYRVN